VHSLGDTQRALAIVSPDALDDVVAGVGHAKSLTFEGLPASGLDTGQQRLLWALIEEYARNAGFEAADAQIEAIKSAGLEKLFFSWRGPIDNPAAPYYYRVHGPRILVEYAVQEPNQIHTITRDPSNDMEPTCSEFTTRSMRSGEVGEAQVVALPPADSGLV
jgi:hypothetical protein